MKISFDLDDTLICYQEGTSYEKNRIPCFLKPWLKEPLRLGTCDLIKTLKQYGCEIWIYTTSYRSPFLIRLWLLCYGIHVTEIINQATHNKYFKSNYRNSLPSKNPRAFGIDLHVDDSEGVKIEGERYGFDVIIISPEDSDWVSKIINEVLNRL